MIIKSDHVPTFQQPPHPKSIPSELLWIPLEDVWAFLTDESAEGAESNMPIEFPQSRVFLPRVMTAVQSKHAGDLQRGLNSAREKIVSWPTRVARKTHTHTHTHRELLQGEEAILFTANGGSARYVN